MWLGRSAATALVREINIEAFIREVMEVAEHYGILIALSKDDGGTELWNDCKLWEL